MINYKNFSYQKIYFLFIFASVFLCINSVAYASEREQLTLENASIAFTIVGNGNTIARIITTSNNCPTISWNQHFSKKMAERVKPNEISSRTPNNAPNTTNFPVLTCEFLLPQNAYAVKIGDKKIPYPSKNIKRIVLIGDTGCRMKASENYFQACNDEDQWPFAKIARNASLKNPDLVIHLGDIHYRESPCPSGNLGCLGSPSGYGFNTWLADFFKPAEPLLQKAPWIFVRGNHESCSRAGQGWQRFISPFDWDIKKSCDLSINDDFGDYGSPYSVPISNNAQLIIFDSSKSPSKPIHKDLPMFDIYSEQFKQVENLSKNKKINLFLSHHPLYGVLEDTKKSEFSKIESGLTSVLESKSLENLMLTKISATLHGHIHLFEILNYQSDYPPTLIMGNSGSAMDNPLPDNLQLNSSLMDSLKLRDFESYSKYGFATLDKIDRNGKEWQLTEYDIDGNPILICSFKQKFNHCKKMKLN